MRIRLNKAVSGSLDTANELEGFMTQIDPGEYFVEVHPSGHYKLELPNNQYALMTCDDFENSVKSGFIFINT